VYGIVGEFCIGSDHVDGGRQFQIACFGAAGKPIGQTQFCTHTHGEVLGKGLSWCAQPDLGLVVVADCTLYDRGAIASALDIQQEVESDAWLLAHAYLRWGDGMLDRLDGDFAFTIFDQNSGEVFATVDPMGVRSLFYRYERGKRFAFSSRPEALADWCGLDSRIPESRLLEPLLGMEELAYVQPEIVGISRLMAAHSCRVSSAGLRLRRYWWPSQNDPGLAEGDTAGWVEGVRQRLIQAVEKRAPHAERFAITLSGGLDSSSVLALACRQVSIDQVLAYSAIDRGNAMCPETLAIDRVLASTGAGAIQVDVAHLEAHAETALRALESTPRFILGRQGFLPLFDAMSARDGVSVMMNGVDADALFGGQALIERWVRNGQIRLALRDARREDRLLGIASSVPHLRRLWLKANLPRGAVDILRWARQKMALRRCPSPLSFRPALWAQLQAQQRVQRQFLSDSAIQESALGSSSMDALIVTDSVGRAVTRSRAFGIEPRFPFLDRSLIEFSAWIPLQLRQHNGRHKWILRKAMNPYLPHSVTWRGDKYHLACKFSRGLFEPLLDRVIRDFRGSGPAIAPYVNREQFMREVPHWKSGSLSAIWKLNAILLLEHWLSHNSDKVRWGD
jgi:asparagine synthase (glutamine-hydrolysing)